MDLEGVEPTQSIVKCGFIRNGVTADCRVTLKAISQRGNRNPECDALLRPEVWDVVGQPINQGALTCRHSVILHLTKQKHVRLVVVNDPSQGLGTGRIVVGDAS